MNYTRYCLRYFKTRVTVAGLAPRKSSFHLLFSSQIMNRYASTFPYHVHKVSVSQESVTTAGQVIDLEMSVIDTHPGHTDKPTVVGLHGIPGSVVDFEPYIQRLAEKNIRFIGPIFPGFETSEVESWKLYHLNYTSAGQASLVEQVLHCLGIDRASMIMCHSAGGWVGYRLAADTDKVKALCLFNPGCGGPHRSLRPQFVIHCMAWLMRIKSLHFFLMPLLEFVYARLGFMGVKGGEHLMVSQQIVSSQNFAETRQHARKIHEKKVPLLFVYTLNDKFIETSLFEEMLFQLLKVPQDLIIRVNADRSQTSLFGTSVDQEPESAWCARGLQFERGGHIAHKAYSDIIMDYVMQLLHHVETGKL